jgi:antitoxin HicB
MKIMFPAKIIKDKSGMFFVRFMDLEEAVTEGETLEEALFNAREVLTLTLESRMDESMEIPFPREVSEENIHVIAPAARVQAAYLVHHARGKKSMADLARALETSWPAVKRLENPRHSPTLKILEKTAATLGKKLILSFE